MVINTSPTLATSPSPTWIAFTVPSTGEGISTTAISFCTSQSTSSSFTSSPSLKNHLTISPSAIPSPMSGNLNSNAMNEYLLKLKIQHCVYFFYDVLMIRKPYFFCIGKCINRIRCCDTKHWCFQMENSPLLDFSNNVCRNTCLFLRFLHNNCTIRFLHRFDNC